MKMSSPVWLPLGVWLPEGCLLGPRWTEIGSTLIPTPISLHPSRSTPVRHPAQRFLPSSPGASILEKRMRMANISTKPTHTKSPPSVALSAKTKTLHPFHYHPLLLPLAHVPFTTVHPSLLYRSTLVSKVSSMPHFFNAKTYPPCLFHIR